MAEYSPMLEGPEVFGPPKILAQLRLCTLLIFFTKYLPSFFFAYHVLISFQNKSTTIANDH